MNSISELIDDIRAGKMVILSDDETRENEGDLIMAAQCVHAHHVNFMITEGRGLFCMLLHPSIAEQLGLKPMVEKNRCRYGTQFLASIEAASGVTTGISAADRAHTVQVAVSNTASPEDIVSPGHVFPILAKENGVLERPGHTEAACDLARLAGFKPAAVLIEILNPDGTMARHDDLKKFSEKHGLKWGSVADLIRYRQEKGV